MNFIENKGEYMISCKWGFSSNLVNAYDSKLFWNSLSNYSPFSALLPTSAPFARLILYWQQTKENNNSSLTFLPIGFSWASSAAHSTESQKKWGWKAS